MTAVAASPSSASGVLITHPITYPVTLDQIAKLRAESASLTADTPEGYEAIRITTGKLRSARTAVEARRKELKAGALDYGRQVDAAAHEITDRIEEVEAPLKAMKDAVDHARENAKRAAEKAEMLALEAKIKADREAAEALARAEREKEEARLKVEADRQAAERAEFDKARAAAEEKRRIEQAALDAQRAEVEAAQRKLDEEKAALAAAETERLARIKAEEDAKAATERARVEAEQVAASAAEEAARLEALRPETERVRAWAGAFRELAANAPSIESDEARCAIEWAQGRLGHVAAALESYTPTGA